jgi:hypothetical protein
MDITYNPINRDGTDNTDIGRAVSSLKLIVGNIPPTSSEMSTNTLMLRDADGACALKGERAKCESPLRHPLRWDNVEFGRYNIDKNKLNGNVLSFAHKTSNHTVTNLPSMRISDKFKCVILEILNDMPVNLNGLSDTEMEQFRYILKMSKKAFKNPISNNNQELLNRVEIIIGEIAAGNNAKALKVELSQTLNAAHKAGLISAKQVKQATSHFIKK